MGQIPISHLVQELRTVYNVYYATLSIVLRNGWSNTFLRNKLAGNYLDDDSDRLSELSLNRHHHLLNYCQF